MTFWEYMYYVLLIAILILIIVLFVLALTSKSITTNVGYTAGTPNASNYRTLATKLNIGIPYHILTPETGGDAWYYLPNGSYDGQTLTFLQGDPQNEQGSIHIFCERFRITQVASIQTNNYIDPFYLDTNGSIMKAIWYNNAWAFTQNEWNV
jgi:hypothetical protein